MVVGGLGGLGRAIIEWMVSKGARNFLVPSRSGVSSKAAMELVERLKAQGIYMETPCCDASSSANVERAIRDFTTAVPHAPIKGCINSAMALQDAVFDNMTHEQWSRALKAKVDTSWNLHALLPRDMDFFIMLSSLVGVYGALGQSNYSAGCAFQDSIARARTDAGTYEGVSVSLDLGWMKDVGIIAEREDLRRKWESADDIAGVDSASLLGVLDHYCDPQVNSATTGSSGPSQLLVGAVTPADVDKQANTLPWSMTRPLLRSFDRSGAAMASSAAGGSRAKEQSFSQRFRVAETRQKRHGVVAEAFRDKLGRALGVEVDEIDTSRLVSSYGVDSLMAIELRTWIRKDFGVDIIVFELLGGATIISLSKLIVERSEASSKL